jgi:hypothetical protein
MSYENGGFWQQCVMGYDNNMLWQWWVVTMMGYGNIVLW